MRSLGTTSVLPSRAPHRRKARSRTPTNIRTPRTASTLPNPAVRLQPAAPTSAKQRSPAAPADLHGAFSTNHTDLSCVAVQQKHSRHHHREPGKQAHSWLTGVMQQRAGESVPPLVRERHRLSERSAVRRECPNGSHLGCARRTRSRPPHGRSRTCRARGGRSRSTSAMRPRPGSGGRGRRRR